MKTKVILMTDDGESIETEVHSNAVGVIILETGELGGTVAFSFCGETTLGRNRPGTPILRQVDYQIVRPKDLRPQTKK